MRREYERIRSGIDAATPKRITDHRAYSIAKRMKEDGGALMNHALDVYHESYKEVRPLELEFHGEVVLRFALGDVTVKVEATKVTIVENYLPVIVLGRASHIKTVHFHHKWSPVGVSFIPSEELTLTTILFVVWYHPCFRVSRFSELPDLPGTVLLKSSTAAVRVGRANLKAYSEVLDASIRFEERKSGESLAEPTIDFEDTAQEALQLFARYVSSGKNTHLTQPSSIHVVLDLVNLIIPHSDANSPRVLDLSLKH